MQPAPVPAAQEMVQDTASSITINLPAYRLDHRDGDTTWSYHVAIGQPRYPTPRGTFAVTEIVWNPWWVPPASDWARDERVRAPGADNPMGRVKLRFTGLVFIHGTPLVASLGSAASHACVRMADADALALARRVQRRGMPGLTEAALAATLDSVRADSTHARSFVLQAPVRVVVRYALAEVRRDSLMIYPNVYAVRGASARADAMRALAEWGADTLRVDAAALDALVQAGRRRRATAPLAAVLRPAPAR